MTLQEYCNQEQATRQPLGSVIVTAQDKGVTVISGPYAKNGHTGIMLELTINGAEFTGFYTVDTETNRLITSRGTVSCFTFQSE
jgi:hypothetical protein